MIFIDKCESLRKKSIWITFNYEKYKKKDDTIWFVKTAGIRAAALLGVNLVFLAEFAFDMSKTLHVIALCFFAFSAPTLCPIVIAKQWWETDLETISFGARSAFSIFTWLATLLTISAVGLCIYSYSAVAGCVFIFSSLIAAFMFIKYLSYNICNAKLDSSREVI